MRRSFRMDASVPLGGIVLLSCAGAPAAVGYLLVLAVHEFGHLRAAMLVGARPRTVRIGVLRNSTFDWPEDVLPSRRLFVHASGVLAQLVFLTAVAVMFHAGVEDPFLRTLTLVNLVVMVFCLCPLQDNDGAAIRAIIQRA